MGLWLGLGVVQLLQLIVSTLARVRKICKLRNALQLWISKDQCVYLSFQQSRSEDVVFARFVENTDHRKTKTIFPVDGPKRTLLTIFLGQYKKVNLAATQKLLKLGPTQLNYWSVMWHEKRGPLVAPGASRLSVGGAMSQQAIFWLEGKQNEEGQDV